MSKVNLINLVYLLAFVLLARACTSTGRGPSSEYEKVKPYKADRGDIRDI